MFSITRTVKKVAAYRKTAKHIFRTRKVNYGGIVAKIPKRRDQKNGTAHHINGERISNVMV